jgi:putative ubiquitin-RnfH superfamily antitoxin RatB of RatAB toxin-antitoxin module
MTDTWVRATVVYACAEQQWVIDVTLPSPATLRDAFDRSGLAELCPELKTQGLEFGLFHRRRDPSAAVRDGDRIEVYRPLLLDPMAARRLRAQRAKRAR